MLQLTGLHGIATAGAWNTAVNPPRCQRYVILADNGDAIIIDGQLRLKDGAPVTVVTDKPAAERALTAKEAKGGAVQRVFLYISWGFAVNIAHAFSFDWCR
jgi:hypothetical protein